MLTVAINWPDGVSEIYEAKRVRHKPSHSLVLYDNRGDGLPFLTVSTDPNAYVDQSPPKVWVYDANRNIVASYW